MKTIQTACIALTLALTSYSAGISTARLIARKAKTQTAITNVVHSTWVTNETRIRITFDDLTPQAKARVEEEMSTWRVKRAFKGGE
jgi:hypothetical protein